MSYIREVFFDLTAFLDGLGLWGIILMSVTTALFVLQSVYYLSRFGRIAKYRGREAGDKNLPLSVITVIAETDYSYIEKTLPVILAQEHDDFEVVIVDLSSDADFSEALSLKARADGRISITRLAVNPQFPISNKMALNMGIKAARNEHLIFTTPDSRPRSKGWLARMAAGFDGAAIVLGYCGMEIRRAKGNRLMRMDIAANAARWAGAAMAGRPYRGTMCNMGFTKTVYFDHNGFNHLNLNIGEEDLFIQHIAPGTRTAVVLEPDSFVRRRQWGDLKWWRRERLLRSNAFRFYTARARRSIAVELWVRALLFASAAAAIALMPAEVKIFAGALLIIRFGIVLVQTLRVSRKLREPGLWSVLPIYDLCSPLYEASLAITRRLRRTPGLWR